MGQPIFHSMSFYLRATGIHTLLVLLVWPRLTFLLVPRDTVKGTIARQLSAWIDSSFRFEFTRAWGNPMKTTTQLYNGNWAALFARVKSEQYFTIVLEHKIVDWDLENLTRIDNLRCIKQCETSQTVKSNERVRTRRMWIIWRDGWKIKTEQKRRTKKKKKKVSSNVTEIHATMSV